MCVAGLYVKAESLHVKLAFWMTCLHSPVKLCWRAEKAGPGSRGSCQVELSALESNHLQYFVFCVCVINGKCGSGWRAGGAQDHVDEGAGCGVHDSCASFLLSCVQW